MVARNNWAAARPGSALSYPESVLSLPDGVVSQVVPINTTLTVPGPAQDKIRVIDGLSFTSLTAVNPTGARVELVTAPPTSLTIPFFTALATPVSQLPVPPQLGFGETMRVVNSGVVAICVYLVYFDIPADNITLVRTSYGPAPVQLVATPSAGFVNRFLRFGEYSAFSGRMQASKNMLANRDTISHTSIFLQGAQTIYRVNTAAGSNFRTAILTNFYVRAGEAPITVNTVAAVTTTSPVVLGAYETLPE